MKQQDNIDSTFQKVDFTLFTTSYLESEVKVDNRDLEQHDAVMRRHRSLVKFFKQTGSVISEAKRDSVE